MLHRITVRNMQNHLNGEAATANGGITNKMHIPVNNSEVKGSDYDEI